MRQALTFTLFVFYLWTFQLAWSQDVTAAITCSVVDPAGASIVAANFTAKDTEGTTCLHSTNHEGVFNLPRLPVRTYDLVVAAPGFQTSVYRSLRLVLSQTCHSPKVNRYA